MARAESKVVARLREAPRSCPRCLAQPLPAAEGERARYECSSAMCPMKNRAEKLHAASDLNALRVQVGDPRGK